MNDPCPTGYRLPTANELLEIIPPIEQIGTYATTTVESANNGSAIEYSGNQITGETGPGKYVGAGATRIVYGVKKLGTTNAYALRWRYTGAGIDLVDQMANTGGDTYMEITCIKAEPTFNPTSASDFEALDWTSGIVRFFPAAGWRRYDTGTPQSRNSGGLYWSSSVTWTDRAWILYINRANISLGSSNRTGGFSVRCVVEK